MDEAIREHNVTKEITTTMHRIYRIVDNFWGFY